MNGTKAIISAMNVAYEERERRSLLRLNLVAFLFTLGGILGVILALTVIVVVPAALPLLGSARSHRSRCGSAHLDCCLASWCSAWRFSTALGHPARHRWRWITPGSLLAAGLWLAASLAFSFYVSNFGSYDAAYGTLGGGGGVVVLHLGLRGHPRRRVERRARAADQARQHHGAGTADGRTRRVRGRPCRDRLMGRARNTQLE